MEVVGCKSVIRFLYTSKETFAKMKEFYGDDAPSYDVAKYWYR